MLQRGKTHPVMGELGEILGLRRGERVETAADSRTRSHHLAASAPALRTPPGTD